MMSQVQGERVSAESSHALDQEEMIQKGARGRPDVAALASRSDKQIAIMVWHYHDDDLAPS
jgi:xylan 1,4-beta-xylosidase